MKDLSDTTKNTHNQDNNWHHITGYKKIRSVRTGKERAEKWSGWRLLIQRTFYTRTCLNNFNMVVQCRLAKVSLFVILAKQWYIFFSNHKTSIFVTIIYAYLDHWNSELCRKYAQKLKNKLSGSRDSPLWMKLRSPLNNPLPERWFCSPRRTDGKTKPAAIRSRVPAEMPPRGSFSAFHSGYSPGSPPGSCRPFPGYRMPWHCKVPLKRMGKPCDLIPLSHILFSVKTGHRRKIGGGVHAFASEQNCAEDRTQNSETHSHQSPPFLWLGG